MNISDNPVFIVGVPRSGTTMLWSILLRHEEFRGTREITSWNTETSIFHKFPRILEGYFKPDIWPFWYEYFVGDSVAFKQWTVECMKSFILMAAVARQAKRPLEKTPNHLENLDLIEKAFPKAMILHITRHPLDVFASMRKRSLISPPKFDPWLRVSAAQFAHDYDRKIKKIHQDDYSLKILNVRYEDITEDSESIIMNICDFLEIQQDLSIIYGAVPEQKKRKFPYQSNVPVKNSSVWRNALSADEAEIIMSATQESREMSKYE